MFFMRANPLLGQVGGGWALEIETFLGSVKWHSPWKVEVIVDSHHFDEELNPDPH
jgi:hypothetical protein